MPERLGKLRVSEEAIAASIKHSDSFENDIPSFVKGISGRIRREQPELYGYMQLVTPDSGVSDLLAYGLGISLTYEILPKFHTERPVTTNEISVMHQSFIEHVAHEEQDGKQKVVVELAWFIEKLWEDSPIFVNWLVDRIEQIESIEEKNSFLVGVMHTVIPFFMREEAREMEHVLFKEDEGKK